MQNLIRLLAENGKLALAPQLAEAFNAERARREGRSDVSVSSAFELSAEQERDIAQAMKKRLGTDVTLSVHIDKELIGGVVIRAGDLVIDASLRGRLKQLSQTLV
jgi:F-type H+-transporting ATPase subunit delta